MDLASLANPQAAQPQAPQALQGVGGLVQQPPQARPTPTRAETVAGLHRCREIEQASGRLLKDPDVGKANIRPKVMTMGADLIANRVMTLSQFMQGIKNYPSAEDFLGQKKWVERLLQSNLQAQMTLLQDHSQSPPEPPDAEQWSPDSHADHVASLIHKYPGR